MILVTSKEFSFTSIYDTLKGLDNSSAVYYFHPSDYKWLVRGKPMKSKKRTDLRRFVFKT